jgi:hypothetical protein
LKPRCEHLTITTDSAVISAGVSRDQAVLNLSDGTQRRVDHVLLATGYRVDISRYPFLSSELLASIECTNGYPLLDAGFEASVPGLHFLGAPAAWSFGPLMRFIAGTTFTSRALARRVTRSMVGEELACAPLAANVIPKHADTAVSKMS